MLCSFTWEVCEHERALAAVVGRVAQVPALVGDVHAAPVAVLLLANKAEKTLLLFVIINEVTGIVARGL